MLVCDVISPRHQMSIDDLEGDHLCLLLLFQHGDGQFIIIIEIIESVVSIQLLVDVALDVMLSID